MRVGFVSDAHGNLQGLAGALAGLERLGADRVYFLGDAVGYLSGSADVLARLEGDGIPCQLGNHEAMMLQPNDRSRRLEAVYGLERARDELGPQVLARLSEWPARREERLLRYRALLVHGSPTEPLFGYVYPDTDLGPFVDCGYDAVFMGNTHIPFVREQAGVLFVNVGSVGLPRDQGNLGAFALFDADSGQCRVYRYPLDTERYTDDANLDPSVRACFARERSDAFGERLP